MGLDGLATDAAQRTPAADVAIVGGGIIGLSTAWMLQAKHPSATVTVLEKEVTWGAHQTGHNSGVVHSGIYYRPGSLKADLCRRGNRSMVEFCQVNGIPLETCGKLIVAVDASEHGRLDALHARGVANGLKVERLVPAQITEVEPHVAATAGLRVLSTAIVDFGAVCQVLVRRLADLGADLRLGTEVLGVQAKNGGHVIQTSTGEVEAGYIVTCAGLQSDRLAKLCGADPGVKIVPFRGEYYELTPSSRYLVNGLVYPVPNPLFPFLGVHFTRMLGGAVHAGPNAVPGLKREGYRKSDVDLADVAEMLTYPGFWRLARRNAGEGTREIVRSFSKAAFVRSLARLVPEIEADDLLPSTAGVRAQAVGRDGSLLDDFLIVEGQRALHVCNAPSPAATSAFEIGRVIVERMYGFDNSR